MQERSLSTRLVHFCRNKLYFECRARLKSEEGEPEKIQSFTQFRMWPRTAKNESQPTGMGLFKEELYELWKKAAVQYSFRKLTHGSDKLRAIQSLAAEMATSLSSLSASSSSEQETDQYISFAGMWRNNLHRELLWYVERGTRVRPPAHDKRNAPTWSWASLDVRVGFVIGSRSTRERSSSHVELTQEKVRKDDPTGSSRPSQVDWSEENNPFRVISLGTAYPDISPVTARNYIEIDALSRSISRITYVVDEGDYLTYVDRLTFPYSLFVGQEEGEVVVFAHALLDLDNRDNLLSETKPLIYAHVSDEQYPSGLVLQRKDGERSPSGREIWSRVGVATIFHKKGDKILDPPFEGRGSLRSIYII
jgi:hypothetical protein